MISSLGRALNPKTFPFFAAFLMCIKLCLLPSVFFLWLLFQRVKGPFFFPVMVNFNVPPLESILEIKNHLYDLRLPSPLLVLCSLSYVAGNVLVVLPLPTFCKQKGTQSASYMHQSERHERENQKVIIPFSFPTHIPKI